MNKAVGYDGNEIKRLVTNSNNYKLTSNINSIVKRNNDLYEGNNIRKFFNTIPNLNFNYSKTIVENFISGISDYEPNVYTNITTFGSNNDNIDINLMERALNKYINKVFIANHKATLNLDMVRNGCVDGTSFIHVYFDDEVGNISFDGMDDSTGKLRLAIVDVLKVGVSNIYTYDIQDNDWISITDRIMTSSLKDIATTFREKGANTLTDDEIDRLGGSTSYQDWDSNTTKDQNIEDEMCDVITFYYKNRDTGSIHKKIVDFNTGTEICNDIDLCISLFPIAQFNWSRRKGSYYGQSPLDNIAAIQQLINLLASSMTMQEILDIPRLVVNARTINANAITNDPSQIIAVNTANPIGNEISKLQASNQSQNKFDFIEIFKNEMMNIVGYNALDPSKITFDSSKSLIFIQNILNKPLSNVKKFYSDTIEQLAKIIIDYSTSYFKNDAIKYINIKNDDGEYINYPLDLSKLSGHNTSYSIDIKYSTSNIYNDDNVVGTLINFVTSGLIHISEEDLIKLIPESIMPIKDDLIDSIKNFQKSQIQTTPTTTPTTTPSTDSTTDQTKDTQAGFTPPDLTVPQSEIQSILNSIPTSSSTSNTSNNQDESNSKPTDTPINTSTPTSTSTSTSTVTPTANTK